MECGKKVSELAQIILIITLCAAAVLFLVSCVTYFQNSEYIKYATINGGSLYFSLEESGNKAIAAKYEIVLSIALAVSAVVTYFPLRAFGQIVTDTNEIKLQIEKNKEETPDALPEL